MKTSRSQLEASKRYLEKKDRVNVVLADYQKEGIEKIITDYGNYCSVPEFIRDAVSYYISLHRILGDTPSDDVFDNYEKLEKILDEKLKKILAQ